MNRHETDPNDDAVRIAAIAERLADLRLERIRAASRCASQLEILARPLNDVNLISLVARLQLRLSMLLPEKPDAE